MSLRKRFCRFSRIASSFTRAISVMSSRPSWRSLLCHSGCPCACALGVSLRTPARPHWLRRAARATARGAAAQREIFFSLFSLFLFFFFFLLTFFFFFWIGSIWSARCDWPPHAPLPPSRAPPQHCLSRFCHIHTRATRTIVAFCCLRDGRVRAANRRNPR